MFDFSISPLTFLLLLINLLISLYALYMNEGLFSRWAFMPERILKHGEWYRMITGGFLHAGLGHLAFNMIALFSIGRWLEVAVGMLNFGVIYFGSGLAAHFLALYIHKDTPNYTAVGASGSISGVIIGFGLFFPFEKLIIFPIPIGIPAILLAVGFLIFSYVASRKPQGSGFFGRVAHEAHLGGALGGLVLTLILEPRVIPHLFQQLGRLF